MDIKHLRLQCRWENDLIGGQSQVSLCQAKKNSFTEKRNPNKKT